MPTLHPPSREERLSRALGYIFTGLIGFSAVVFPVDPAQYGQSTGARLGLLIYVWAAFMATAFAAAVATLMGRYRVEYVLLPLFTFALLVANVNAWYNVTTIDPTIAARACASSALVCLLAYRWFGLNRLSRVHELWTRIER